MIDYYLQIAIEAVKASKEKLKSEAGQTRINKSEGKDIKLQSDIDSEKIIFEILKEKTDIDILSEEAGFIQGSSDSSLRWIVDPLDGSLNYSRGIPLSCISIALWDNITPILGVIYDFNRDFLYSGIVGEGAKQNNSPIRVSTIESKSDSIICTGFPVYTHFDDDNLRRFVVGIQEYKKVRLLGSAALSLAFVASGNVEAYKENDIAIWDVAAGIALSKAAGGQVKYKFDKKGNTIGNVFVSNV